MFNMFNINIFSISINTFCICIVIGGIIGCNKETYDENAMKTNKELDSILSNEENYDSIVIIDKREYPFNKYNINKTMENDIHNMLISTNTLPVRSDISRKVLAVISIRKNSEEIASIVYYNNSVYSYLSAYYTLKIDNMPAILKMLTDNSDKIKSEYKKENENH
jgi:hypothetical protein